MSATTVQHVSLLTPSVTPLNSRGARLAALLFMQFCQAIGYGKPVSKQASASHGAATRAEQAHEVRAMAWQVERSDPGFAADLYAAAARHEGLPA